MLSVRSEKKTFSSVCKICGAPAEYAYYGVISCQSCKIFFRRHARKQKRKFKCAYGGHCEINANDRRCIDCRLNKCFDLGMSADLFRPSLHQRKMGIDQSNSTKSLIKRNDQPAQFPPLNLLQSDTSLMTTGQWTLLTNLIHCYDEMKVFLTIDHIKSQLKTPQITNLISLDEFYYGLYQQTEVFIRSNRDLCNLSTDNRSSLIRNMTDSVTCLGGTLAFSRSLSYNDDDFWNRFVQKYGQRTKDVTHYAMKFIDSDVILMKLSLGLMVCSQHHSIFLSNMTTDHLDTLAMFKMQNTYAELIWNYLLYKYGYRESIMRFLNLTHCLMSVIVAMGHVQSVQAHIDDIQSVVENIEVALILDDIEIINDENIS